MKGNQYEIHTTINGNVYVWDKWDRDWSAGEMGCYITDVVDVKHVFEDKIIWGRWWIFRWRKGVERVMIRSIPKKEKRDFGSIESAKRFIDERRKENNVVVSKFPYASEDEATE